MNTCSTHELSISAIFDGEAGRDDIVAVLDHLTSCTSCQDFFRACRTLQGAAASLGVSAGMRGRAQSVHLSSMPSRWGWALAASIVVALGFWVSRTWLQARDSFERAVILDPSPLTEERFVALTNAMLRAEPQYRHVLLEVLQSIDGAQREGSLDLDAPGDETRTMVPPLDAGDLDFAATDLEAENLPR